jgi:hypothetical protein
MPGVFIPSRGAQVQPAGGSEGPPPGFLDQLGASFRTSKDDISYVQDYRLEDAYQPIFDALYDLKGKQPGDYISRWDQAVSAVNPFGTDMDKYDVDAIWRDVQAAQAKGGLQGLPKDRESFEKAVLTRKGERAKDQQILARGDSYVAPFLGGMGSMVFDPVNIMTAPISVGSKTIAQAALRGAILNSAIEGVQQVPLAGARERMGEKLTFEEAAFNVATAAAFGGLFEGAGFAIGKNWDSIKAAPKAVQEKAWAKIVSSSPALQKRLGNAMDWDAIGDADLPDIAEAMIGLENLSPDEKGFIAAMRRDAQIEGMNPYIPDGAGIAAHHNELAAAMQRIIDNAPPTVPKRRVAPVAAASGPLPRLRASTAVSSGTVAGDAFAVVKSRIGVVESGGNNRAKNPNSSATGTYQFVSGTWLKLYKSRFGSQGLSDGQIIAKRADSKLQEILMTDLMNANGKALRDGGHAVDAGNLYLAHFAGSAGANKLLRADPNTSARAVLGDAVIKANPFLAKMNAADVINWAHRKMTGKGGAVQSSIGTRQSDIDPEADSRDWVARELAAVDAERARLDAEDDAQPDMGAIVDDSLQSPKDFEDSFAASMAEINAEIEAKASRPTEPAARLADAAPVEVLAVLPELRKVVQSRSIRLDRQKEIAEALGTDIETVRAGLGELAKLREIRVKAGKDGTERFTQIPRDNRPEDLLRFIARRGGLSETGLDPRFKNVEGVSSGHALGKGGRDWDKHFVHGAGRLVRKNGIGLDEMGEKLWDAGYFGPPDVVARPTESELIDAIEEAVQGRGTRYVTGEAPEERSIRARAPWLDEADMMDMRRDFDAAADERGISLDDEAFETVARMYADGDYENVGEAIVDMINREIEADIAAKYYELGDQFDESRIEQFLASAREAGFDIDGGFDRPEVDAGNAATVGASGRNAFGQNDQGPIELAPDAYKPFDDPGEGAGVTGQIDSMEHDLRAVVGQQAPISDQVNDVLQADGWKFSSGEYSKRFEGVAEQGQMSDGARTTNLRIDETGRWLERMDGFNIANDVDLRRFPNDPQGAIRAVMAERGDGDAADMFGGATDVEKRQALERRGEGGLDNGKDQKPVGSDGGLFDPDSWAQAGFRLDAEGDVVNPADLLAEFDAEDAILKTIKDCL